MDNISELTTFALDNLIEREDHIICEGKLFEAGDYPDKDFSLSENELITAAAAFQPVP